MYYPLVSIIIPVYKGEKYMREAIDSALAQTYRNLEILVINDGSPDDGATERIAQEYGDRIRYFHKENGGCASALNEGIAHMRGEWFSWLSHDDSYQPDKIERELACIESYGLQAENTIIACGVNLIDQNGEELFHPVKAYTGLYTPLEMFRHLLLERTVTGCGLLIPKTVLDRTGTFDTHLKFILDWEYWLRTVLAGADYFLMEDRRLVNNRIHGDQVTVRCSDLLNGEKQEVVRRLTAQLSSETGKTDYCKVLYDYTMIHSFSAEAHQLRTCLEARNALSAGEKWRIFGFRVKKWIREPAKWVYRRLLRR